MSWREAGILDERLRFVAAFLEGAETMVGLCEAFGISRKTGYKWLARHRALGPAGLHDRPRAPLRHGRATPEDIVAAILAEKEAHPLWGPKKLIARLKRRSPEMVWPAVSTTGEILKRHGLVGRRRRRWRASGNGPWSEPEAPNELWTMDYKGWFRTGDGRRCEPLTVMDAKSRYLLALKAAGSTAGEEAWPVFEGLFETYGLPDRLRSDNGPPFASAGITGLTALSVRFIKLGIRLERIDPGKPQQNGRHERFHLTLAPLARAPASDLQAQQTAFEAFRRIYNEDRPHEALDQAVPAEHYHKAGRPMPSHPPEPDYPPEAAVRKVRSNGEIKWNGELVYLAESLAGEAVAIQETEAGEWTVHFHAHPLGVIDKRTAKLRRSGVTPLKGRDASNANSSKL
jgi:putative transposase